MHNEIILTKRKELEDDFEGIVATIDSEIFEGHAKKVYLEEVKNNHSKPIENFNVVNLITADSLTEIIKIIVKKIYPEMTKVPNIAIISSESIPAT